MDCLRCIKRGKDSVVPSDTTTVLAPSSITLEQNDASEVSSPERPLSKSGKNRAKAPTARYRTANKPMSEYVFPRSLQLEAIDSLQVDRISSPNCV